MLFFITKKCLTIQCFDYVNLFQKMIPMAESHRITFMNVNLHNNMYHVSYFSTPKSSKSCKKIRSAQVPSQRFFIGSHKANNQIYETSQIILKACEVLLEARNYLRNIIKEFNQIINLREELACRLSSTLKEETNVSVIHTVA